MDRLVIFYFCSVAGLVMIVGGIWLLSKQKIYLDAKTGAVVSFDIPLLGKVKTNVPSLGLFVIGAGLLIWPLTSVKSIPDAPLTVAVKGSVSSSEHPMLVYAVVRSEVLQQDEGFTIAMPEDIGPGYDPRVLYIPANTPGIFEDKVELAMRKNGSVELLPKKVQLVSSTAPSFPPQQPQIQQSSDDKR